MNERKCPVEKIYCPLSSLDHGYHDVPLYNENLKVLFTDEKKLYSVSVRKDK